MIADSNNERHPRRWWVVAAVCVVAAGAGLGIYEGVFAESSQHTEASVTHGSRHLHLSYPRDWKQISTRSVPSAPKNALFAIHEVGREGLLIVRVAGRAPAFTTRFVANLNKTFKAHLPDYSFVTAQTLRTKAGKVFFFAYLRKKEGRLHTIGIIPSGAHSFVIDTASNPASRTTTSEIRAIISSARLT